MKLNQAEMHIFQSHAKEILLSERFQEMNNYIQHGHTSTLTHCMVVAYYSYWLSLRLPHRMNTRSIVRGALLHDFFLYDWHIPDDSHKLHGFVHPGFALVNARKYFSLNHTEEDIIATHMWPLTITKRPRSREALLVCLTDKYVSFAETLHISLLSKDVTHFITGIH